MAVKDPAVDKPPPGEQISAVSISGDSLTYELPPRERNRRLKKAGMPWAIVWLFATAVGGLISPSPAHVLLWGAVMLIIPGTMFLVSAWPVLRCDTYVRLKFAKGVMEYEVNGKRKGGIELPDIGDFRVVKNSPNKVFPDLMVCLVWVMRSGEKMSFLGLLGWKGHKLLNLRVYCRPEDIESIAAFMNGQMAKHGRPVRETLSKTLHFGRTSAHICIFSAEA